MKVRVDGFLVSGGTVQATVWVAGMPLFIEVPYGAASATDLAALRTALAAAALRAAQAQLMAAQAEAYVAELMPFDVDLPDPPIAPAVETHEDGRITGTVAPGTESVLLRIRGLELRVTPNKRGEFSAWVPPVAEGAPDEPVEAVAASAAGGRHGGKVQRALPTPRGRP